MGFEQTEYFLLTTTAPKPRTNCPAPKRRELKLSGQFDSFDLTKIQTGLSSNTGLMFESGVVSGQFNGTATNESVDLTVDISISNLKAKGQGKGILGLGSDTTSQAFDALKELETTIRIVGPVTEPRLVFDVKGLTDEFKKALV